MRPETVSPPAPTIEIASGSKSFFLASLFFGRRTREACWELYRWCRYGDDLVDGSSDLEEARRNLHYLQEQTSRALAGEDSLPVFSALAKVCRQYQIPSRYPLDLVEGFEMDTQEPRFRSIGELEVYCYHVAGTVGLMMAHIMGVSAPVALTNAIDLGNAMQLTNICRDVAEDYRLGRVYLPMNWLEAAGIEEGELLHAQNRERLHSVVLRVLDRADELYRSGYSGLKYLPLRAAFTIALAGSIYSAIGDKIRKQGPRSLEARTFVPLTEKIWLIAKAAMRIAPLAFQRLHRPWVRAALPEPAFVWLNEARRLP